MTSIPQNDNKRILKNTLFLYMRLVLTMCISLYSTRVLFSVLGVEDFGVYNVVCGFVTMFSFLNTSMANGTQRFYNVEIGKNKGINISGIFTHAIYIQAIISFVIVLAVETVGLWYLYNKMVIPASRFDAASWIFQFAMIKLVMVMLSVPFTAAIMAYERMNFYALLGILDSVLNLIVVLLLKKASVDSLILYGALSLAIGVVNLVLNVTYCRVQFKHIHFVREWNQSLFKKMFSFSGWNVFGSFSHIMQSQGLNMVFNYFWGPVVNAANGVASQVNSAISGLTSGFLTAVRPQMIQNYAKGDLSRFEKMYYSSSKLTFFLIMVLAVPIISDIDEILDIWIGAGKYPEITAIFCQLTIIASLCNSYATPSSIVVHATGRMKKFQIVVSSVLIIVVPVSVVVAMMGCPPYSLLIANAVINVLAHIVRLFIIREQIDFKVLNFVKRVVMPTCSAFVAAMLFSVFLHFVFDVSGLLVLIRLTICLFASVAIIYLLGLSAEERTLFSSMIKNKLHLR